MPPARRSRRIAASGSAASASVTWPQAMPLPSSPPPVESPRPLSAVQSAQPWSGPSTTDLAAEMIRQMQAQGLVMSPPATASQHAVSPPSATSPSPVPSAQPALANVIAGMTGEREASGFTSLSMPVDLHIDVKLRTKIQANGYVDFGRLLSRRSEATEQYQLQVTGDSVALVRVLAPPKFLISNSGQRHFMSMSLFTVKPTHCRQLP